MSEHHWREYKETGDLSLRNRLVLTYVPLVKHSSLFGELASQRPG